MKRSPLKAETLDIEDLTGFSPSESPHSDEMETEEFIIGDETDQEESGGTEQNSEEEVSDLADENRELRESLIRLQAEFENYRKRQAREFRRLSIQGKRALMVELLAVLDNFDRAMLHRDENGHPPQEIAEGMFRTADLMRRILEQEGLQALDVRSSDPFDPNIHEAMVATEVDGIQIDTVLEILEKGYLLNDELLRPARVVVGKPLKDSISADPASSENEGGQGEE